MPQTLPEGKRETGPAWPTVPLAARVLRQGRRKEESLIVLRRVPVAFPALTDAEAPVRLRLSGPERIESNEWPYLRRAAELGCIRHDGERWWRPVPAPHRRGPLRLDDFDEAMDYLRREGHATAWRDWPFAVALDRFAHRRTAVLPEAELCLRALHTDLDAAALAESTALAGRFGVVDGVLHRRCDEPVLEVRAIGLPARKVSQVVLVPKAAHDPESRAEGSDAALQAFRPDEAAEARAYAAAVAAALGRKAVGGRVFEVAEGARFARSTAAALPGEATGRFVARTRALVGDLDRAAAEAWLDLRDAGPDGGVEAVGARFGRLLDRLVEANPRGWAAVLAWFEAHRLLPDSYAAGAEDPLAEDAEALAGVC